MHPGNTADFRLTLFLVPPPPSLRLVIGTIKTRKRGAALAADVSPSPAPVGSLASLLNTDADRIEVRIPQAPPPLT